LQRQSAPDLHRRPLLERREHRALHRGLVDRDQRRMAEAAHVEPDELDRTAVGGQDARAGHHLRVRPDGGVEADGLEDAQDLVVDDGGARQRIWLVVTVEGQRSHPLVAEQEREQLSDGSEAADDHVVVGHGVTPAVPWC